MFNRVAHPPRPPGRLLFRHTSQSSVYIAEQRKIEVTLSPQTGDVGDLHQLKPVSLQPSLLVAGNLLCFRNDRAERIASRSLAASWRSGSLGMTNLASAAM